MSMHSNFNCWQAQHNCQLTLLRPSDVPDDVSASLADSAGGFNIVLPDQAAHRLEWSLTFTEPTALGCVYFQGLSIEGLSLKLVGIEGDLINDEIAFAEQIDDFLLARVPTGLAYAQYTVIVNIPANSGLELFCSAPFIGGVDLGALTPLHYDNGREYDFTPRLEYQSTLTTQIPHRLENFAAKAYPVKTVSSSEVAPVYDFISTNTGRLVLFVEFEPQSKHDLTLGTLESASSRRDTPQLNTFNLAIKAKTARQ